MTGRLAWTLDLRALDKQHDRDMIRDWLTLHGIRASRIVDRPGTLDVWISSAGAYLHTNLDTGAHHTPLVMGPPDLDAATCYLPIRRHHIAEGATRPMTTTPRRHTGAPRLAIRPPAQPPARTAPRPITPAPCKQPLHARARTWWRHRPNPVAAAICLLAALYLGTISYLAWSGPWTLGTTTAVLATGGALLRIITVATNWARRWRRRQP